MSLDINNIILMAVIQNPEFIKDLESIGDQILDKLDVSNPEGLRLLSLNSGQLSLIGFALNYMVDVIAEMEKKNES